jgi:HAD superfamily hydrolase (TIGR01484 family)
MIKIIGMDFDWTLIDHTPGSERIGKELIEFMNGFIMRGGQAGIVSGRPLDSVKEAFRNLDVPWGPFPSFVIGREAYIHFSDSVIDKIPQKALAEANEWNRIMEEKLYVMCDRVSLYINKWLADIKKAGINVRNFYLFGNYAFEFHADCNESADKAVEMMKEFAEEAGFSEAEIHRNNNLVSMIHQSGGKGNVLAKFAELLGYSPEQVLACGDSMNDSSMLDGSKGFVCGCVGNADPALIDEVALAGGICAQEIAWRGVLELCRVCGILEL